MADYYLINDQIKFYFDIEDQYIEFQSNKESLEPKETKILKYIIENHVDGLIKSEDILDNNWDYWSDKKVLQKVLSTLRRKFKLIGVTENGFIAAGTDYKINYHGILVNDQAEQQKAKKAYTNKILNKINSAAIWAFLGAISIFLLIESKQGADFKVDNIFQATALSGVSLFPALSPDGQAIVFAHKTEDTATLYLKVESNLSYIALTEGHTDQMPAWSINGRKIAFQRSDSNEKCEIRLIELDQDYNKLGPDKKLFDCNPLSTYNSIAWRSDDEFFYSERQGNNAHYDIMLYSLSQQKSTPYYEFTKPVDAKVFSGHHFITYNQHDKSLYTLSSPDFFASHINRFDENGTQSLIHKVDDILLSISTYQNTIIFKDIDNQLKAVSVDNSEHISTIYQNPLKPIAYPRVSSDSNKMLLLSGSLFKDDIYAMNLKDGTTTQVLSSQFRLNKPQQINDQLYFISDRTGIRQIYSYNQIERRQITNFTKNHRIIYFSASNDHRWLAINFLDKTVLYKRQPEGITVAKTFPLMSHPAFSLNNKRLLLATINSESNDNDEKWTHSLVEFDLNTMQETGIKIKNASFGKYHDSGIVFAQPEGGVQLFTLNGVKTILADQTATTPLFLSVNKDYVFVSNLNNTISVNIKTKEQIILPQPIKEQITSNDSHIFYRKKLLNNLSIFKGDLIYQ